MRRLPLVVLAAVLAALVWVLLRSDPVESDARALGASASTSAVGESRDERNHAQLEAPANAIDSSAVRSVVDWRDVAEKTVDELHALVTGVVREQGTGAPIPGADVMAQRKGGIGFDVECLADAAGRFQLVVDLRSSPVTLLAGADGFGGGRVEAVDVSSGRAACVVELPRLRVAVGRIVDAAGVAARGVSVRLKSTVFTKSVNDGGGVTRSLGSMTDMEDETTDAEGRFRFRRLHEHVNLRLEARRGEREVAARELDEEHASSAVVDFGDVALEPARRIEGLVTRPWRGDPGGERVPYAGVELELALESLDTFDTFVLGKEPGQHERTRTDERGAFEVRGLLPGRYRIVPRTTPQGEPLDAKEPTPYGRSWIHRGTEPPVTPEGLEVVVDLTTELEHSMHLSIPRTQSLRGVVIAPDGTPAANATVEARWRDVVVRGKADAEGRFELAGLGRDPVTLVVRPTQSAKGTLPETRLEGVAPGTNVVRVVLAAAAFVEGRVVDAEGKRVSHAAVTARTSMRVEVDFAYADEEGRFRLRVPAGEAVDLEARPSKEAGGVRKLDAQSALVAEACGVRANGGEVVLTLAPKR